MSNQPFMQLYVGDYLADTLDLSTEEHGAYLLLLMTMWRHDARLPNDPKKLARIARVSPRRWHLIWENISTFFFEDGDRIGNKRLEREHQKAISISEKRIASGAKGGRAKALKNNNAHLANASDLPKHSQKSEPERKKEAAVRRDSEPIDYAALRAKLLEAGGKTLNRTSAALESFSDPLAWMEQGADLETDILQTIRDVSQRVGAQGRTISGWGYFTKAVAEAKSRRQATVGAFANAEAAPQAGANIGFKMDPSTPRFCKPAPGSEMMDWPTEDAHAQH